MPDPTDAEDRATALAVLERAVAGVVAGPDLEDRVARGVARRARTRRRATVLAGAAAAVVVVLVAVAVARPPDDGEDRVRAGPPATTTVPPDDSDPVPSSPTDLAGLAGGRWQDIAPSTFAPGRREAAAWATSERYVLVWGGQPDGGAVMADGVVLDLETGRWRGIDPRAGVGGRWGATAVLDGDVAWIVGGSSEENGGAEPVASEDVLRIDLGTGAVEVATTSPRAARMEPALAVHDGQVVVAGGRRADADDLTVAALDPATGAWRDGPDLPWGTSSSDYTAGDGDPAPAGVDASSMLIARTRLIGTDADATIEVARLDLATLETATLAPIDTVPGVVPVREVRVVGGAEGAVLLYDADDGIQGIGRTDAGVVWHRALPLGSCEGPPGGQVLATVAVASVCGLTTLVDRATGTTADIPTPPQPDSGSLVTAGDRLLHLWVSDAGGTYAASVLVAG